jgi:hypothetical protein
MRFLSSLGRWVKNSSILQHRFFFGAVFLFVGAVVLLGPTHFSFAADPLAYADAAYGQMLLWIAGIINVITGYIAEFSLSIIEMIIVPILQYNNFISSPTIGLGWSLVRDVVNMFVIIVLLVIAIATVVGYKKISWEQALPQFLLAVILVNFSRTICGILIDVSQVIMFTFVNALLDVAAGNFAVLLGYDNFGQYSNSAVYDPTTGASKYIDAAQQVGAAYMLFVLYASIFAVLLLLALVYIWRIVVLWVLVIMSPLTFFLGGLKGMFKFADGANGEWWKKFTACLVLGPMLTFFLWLALATGTGDITESEGFPVGESTLSATLVSFETSHLLGTLLGLILLVVGMQQSASFANSMGGVAASVINEKMGRKIVSGIARAPVRAGGELARQTDRRLGSALGTTSGTAFLAGQLGGGLSSAASRVPLVGSQLGRSVAAVTGAIQTPIEHQVHEEKKAAKDRIGKYTDDQLVQHVRLMADGKTSALGLSTRDDIDAIKIKALTDGDFRKKMKKEIGVTNYENIMRDALKMSDDHVKHSGGDLDKLAKAKSQNVHLLSDSDRDKFIQSDKFVARDMSEEAAATKAVRDAMKKKYLRTDNNGRDITAEDELLKGAYGESLRKAALGAGLAPVYDTKQAADALQKGDKFNSLSATKDGEVQPYTADQLAASILAGRIKPSNISVDDLRGGNGEALTKALLQTGTSVNRIADGADDHGRAAQSLFKANANELLSAGKLDVNQTLQVDIASLDSGIQPQVQFATGTSGTGDAEMLNAPDVDRISRVLEKNPRLASKFSNYANSMDAESLPIKEAIIRTAKIEELKRMTEQFANAVTEKDRQAIRDNVDTIARAIESYVAMSNKRPGKGDQNLYKQVGRAAMIVGAKRPKITGVADVTSEPEEGDKTT